MMRLVHESVEIQKERAVAPSTCGERKSACSVPNDVDGARTELS